MPIFAPFQCLVRIANFALTGQENQYIANGFLALNFIAGGNDAIQQCALTGILMVAAHFAIAHLYRIAAPFHTHHRRTTKVCGEALGINRGRGDNQLQVGPTWQ